MAFQYITLLSFYDIKYNCVSNIQSVPGGMDKTSGECSIC